MTKPRKTLQNHYKTAIKNCRPARLSTTEILHQSPVDGGRRLRQALVEAEAVEVVHHGQALLSDLGGFEKSKRGKKTFLPRRKEGKNKKNGFYLGKEWSKVEKKVILPRKKGKNQIRKIWFCLGNNKEWPRKPWFYLGTEWLKTEKVWFYLRKQQGKRGKNTHTHKKMMILPWGEGVWDWRVQSKSSATIIKQENHIEGNGSNNIKQSAQYKSTLFHSTPHHSQPKKKK